MKRFAIAAGALALCAGIAFAGPFEEGAAAYGAGDFAKAMTSWKAAADAGDARGAFNVGVLNDQGKGVAQSAAEALKWSRAAAEKGDVIAQFNLGLILAEGKGVPQDFTEAAKWYEQAANKKHALAQQNLATLYANGQGVEQDLGKAAEWSEKASETVMNGENTTACGAQRSLLMLETCRRAVPRM